MSQEKTEYFFMDGRANILKRGGKPVVVFDREAALAKLKELNEFQPEREWIVQPPIYDFEE